MANEISAQRIAFVLNLEDPDDIVRELDKIFKDINNIAQRSSGVLEELRISNAALKSFASLGHFLDDILLKVDRIFRKMKNGDDLSISVRLDEQSIKSLSKIFADIMGASLQSNLSKVVKKTGSDLKRETAKALAGGGSGGSGGGGGGGSAPSSGSFGGGRIQASEGLLNTLKSTFDEVENRYNKLNRISAFVTSDIIQRNDDLFRRFRGQGVGAFSTLEKEVQKGLLSQTKQLQREYGELIIDLSRIKRLAASGIAFTVESKGLSASLRADLQEALDRTLKDLEATDLIPDEVRRENAREVDEYIRSLQAESKRLKTAINEFDANIAGGQGPAQTAALKALGEDGTAESFKLVRRLDLKEVEDFEQGLSDQVATLEEINQRGEKFSRILDDAVKSENKINETIDRKNDLLARTFEIRKKIAGGGLSLVDENDRFELETLTKQFERLGQTITQRSKSTADLRANIAREIEAESIRESRLRRDPTASPEELQDSSKRIAELKKENGLLKERERLYAQTSVEVNETLGFLRQNVQALKEVERAEKKLSQEIQRSVINVEQLVAGLSGARAKLDNIDATNIDDVFRTAGVNIREADKELTRLAFRLEEIESVRARNEAKVRAAREAGTGVFAGDLSKGEKFLRLLVELGSVNAIAENQTKKTKEQIEDLKAELEQSAQLKFFVDSTEKAQKLEDKLLDLKESIFLLAQREVTLRTFEGTEEELKQVDKLLKMNSQEALRASEQIERYGLELRVLKQNGAQLTPSQEGLLNIYRKLAAQLRENAKETDLLVRKRQALMKIGQASNRPARSAEGEVGKAFTTFDLSRPLITEDEKENREDLVSVLERNNEVLKRKIALAVKENNEIEAQIAVLKELQAAGVELSSSEKERIRTAEGGVALGRESIIVAKKSAAEVDSITSSLDKSKSKVSSYDSSVKELVKSLEKLDAGNADSELVRNLDRDLKELRPAADKLSKSFVELKKDIKSAFGSNSPETDALEAKIDGLVNKLEAARRKVGEAAPTIGTSGARVDVSADFLNKAPKKVSEMEANLRSLNTILAQSGPELRNLGQNADIAASEITKVGSQAKSASFEAQKLLSGYEMLEKAGIRLSDSEKQNQMRLRDLIKGFRSAQKEVGTYRTEIELAKRAQRNFGEELGQSIIQNLKFVEAITLVSSIVFIVRAAFTQLIEDSRALGRSFTVLRSTTMGFSEAAEVSAMKIREISIAFGETVQDTAEVAKQLGSAGFTLEETFAAIVPTMQLVVATTADAEQTARLIAGVYKVFGSELRQTGSEAQAFSKIADTLTTVYQNHQAELDEINQGLRFTGAAAKAVGISFSDTTAFLAVLNDNMIKSGAAGRGLQVVFSQLAAKSAQIESAFNVKIDKNSPLGGDQFVQLLKKINERYREGALSVKDLDQAFKIFGLRGARTFITLVKQSGDVEKAVKRLRDGTDNAAANVARIIGQTLAKEFEKAKQGLLDLARGFVDSFKEIIKLVADIVAAIRSFDQALGPVSGLLKGIFSIGIGFTVIIQTFAALGQVFAVLTGETRLLLATMFPLNKAKAESVALSGAEVNASNAVATAKVREAEATALNATASGTEAQMVKKSAAAKDVAGKAAVSLGAKIGLAVAAFTVLALAISAIITTNKELQESLQSSVFEISNIDRDIQKLDDFQSALKEIEIAAMDAGKSSEVIGQRIVDAFRDVGPNLVSDAQLITRTNTEIAASFDEIKKSALEAAAAQEAALRNQRKKEVKEASETVQEVISRAGGLKSTKGFEGFVDNNLSGFFGAFDYLSPEAAKSIARTNSDLANYVDLLKKVEDAQKKIATGAVSEIEEKRLEMFEKRLPKAKKAYTEAVDEIQAEIGRLSQIDPAAGKEAREGFFKAVRDELGKDVEDFVKETLEARLSRIVIESAFKVEAPTDFQATVGQIAEDIFNIVEEPFNQEIFENTIRGLNDLKIEVQATDQAFKDFNALILERDTAIRSGDVTGVARAQDTIGRFGSFNFSGIQGADISNEFESSLSAGFFDAVSQFKDNRVVRRSLVDAYEEVVKNSLRRGKAADNASVNRLFEQNYGDTFKKLRKTFKTEIPEDGGVIRQFFVGENEELTQRELTETANLIGRIFTKDIRKVSNGLTEVTVEALTFNDALNATTAAAGIMGSAVDKVAIQSRFLNAETEANIALQSELLKKFAEATIEAANQRVILNDVQKRFREIRRLGQEIEFKGFRDTSLQETLSELQGQYLAITGTQIGQGVDLSSLTEDQRKLAEGYRKDFKEILDLETNRKLLQLETNALLTERRNSLDVEIAKSKSLANAYESQTARLSDGLRLANFEARKTFNTLVTNQQIFGASLVSSLEGLSTMLSLVNNITAKYREYVNAVREEASLRFDLIGQIDRIFNPEDATAGIEARFTSLLNRVDFINAKLERVQGDTPNDIKERTKLYKDLIDLYSKMLDLRKEMKRKLEEIQELEISDNRAQGLKAISGRLEKDIDKLENTLSKGFDRRLELDPQFAVSVARALGRSVQDVRLNLEEAREDFIRGIQKGEIRPEAIGFGTTRAAMQLKELSEEAELTQKRITELQERTFRKTTDLFNQALLEGQLKKARTYLDNLRSLVPDIAGDDSLKFNQLQLDLIKREEELLNASRDRQAFFELEIKMKGLAKLEGAFSLIRERLGEIRSDLVDMSKFGSLTAEQIQTILKGDVIGLEGFLRENIVDAIKLNIEEQLGGTLELFDGIAERFKNQNGKLGETAKQLQDAARIFDETKDLIGKPERTNDPIAPVKKAYGGRIPGFGGGDIIPALLEPGEFVIPKEAVAKYGTGMLEMMRNRTLQQFTKGGPSTVVDIVGTYDPETKTFSFEGDIGSLNLNDIQALISAMKSIGFMTPKIALLIEALESLEVEVRKAQNMTSAVDGAMAAASKAQEKAARVEDNLLNKNGDDPLRAALSKAELDDLLNVLAAPNQEEALKMIRESDTALSAAKRLLEDGDSNQRVLAQSVLLFVSGAKDIETAIKDLKARGIDIDGDSIKEALRQPSFKEEMENIREVGSGVISDSPVLQELQSLLSEGVQNAFGSAIETVTSDLDLSFINDNVDAFMSFIEALSDADIQFQDTFTGLQEDIQRTQVSYFDYIDAVEEAEMQRIKSRVEAEKQYREELKKTGEIFADIVKNSSEKAFEGLSGLLERTVTTGAESVFGSFEDNFKSLTGGISDFAGILSKQLSASIGKGQGGSGVIAGLFGAGGAGGGLLSSLGGGALSSSAAAIGMGAAGAGVGIIVPILLKVVSGIGTLVQNLVMITAADDRGKKQVEFIEKFFKELPKAGPEFIDKLVENTDRIVTAFIGGVPVLFRTLSNELPEFIMTFVNGITDAIPVVLDGLEAAMPDLIDALVPAFVQLLVAGADAAVRVANLVGQAIPQITIALIRELPTILAVILKVFYTTGLALVLGVIQGFIQEFRQIGDMSREERKATRKERRARFTSVFNFEGIGELEQYHTGGFIGGRRDEVVILAQRGEGVLSRTGMRALGGVDNLNMLNKGMTPREMNQIALRAGGLSNMMSTNQGIRPVPSQANNKSASTSQVNEFNFDVTFNDPSQMLDPASRKKAVDEFEDEIAKRIRARDSKISRALKDRNNDD